MAHYTVVRGDTLWHIARRYDVSVDEIVSANRLEDVDSIEVGQRLSIPLKAAPVALRRVIKKFDWPVKGSVVVRFGERQEGVVSKGIGIRAKLGSRVEAAQSGTVSFIGDRVRGYGKMIILDHGDDYESVYAHNSENLVRLGQRVKRGQSIALVGKSGRAKFPYLYFEIRWRHQPQDPLIYLE